MTYRLIGTAAIVATALATGLAQDRVRPTGARLSIDIVAVDGKGRPVEDLRPQELEVWIQGYRVPIEALEYVTLANRQPTGRTIVLLLDDITLDPTIVPRARDFARRFVTTMAADDRIRLVTLTGASVERTAERTRLLQWIEAFNVRATGVQRIDTLSEQVLGILTGISRPLVETPGSRKTIVAIGSAWLFDTPIPPPTIGRDLRREWTDAVKTMAQAHANLYVVDPGGVGMSRVGAGESGFARDTGGRAFANTNDFNGVADRIMREAATYYVIEVADPPVGRKSELRDLDVRVQRRGISVRARRAIPGGGT